MGAYFVTIYGQNCMKYAAEGMGSLTQTGQRSGGITINSDQQRSGVEEYSLYPAGGPAACQMDNSCRTCKLPVKDLAAAEIPPHLRSAESFAKCKRKTFLRLAIACGNKQQHLLIFLFIKLFLCYYIFKNLPYQTGYTHRERRAICLK